MKLFKKKPKSDTFLLIKNYLILVLAALAVTCAFVYITHLGVSESKANELEHDKQQLKEEITKLENEKIQLYHSIDTVHSIESISDILSNLDTNKSR